MKMSTTTPQGQHYGDEPSSSVHPLLAASGGIDPDRDASLKTIPQPKMVVDLRRSIDLVTVWGNQPGGRNRRGWL